MNVDCNQTSLVVGVADGGIPIWELLPGIPLMANILTTKKFPPRGIGELWIDSGGYQALRKGMRLSVDWVISRYDEVEADLYIMLDSPPPYGVGDWESAKENLALYEDLYSRLDDKTIVPVVHHYDSKSLIWFLNKVEYYKPQILAVGGSVPGLLNRGKKRAATIVYLTLVRRLWPRKLHVLGAGSPVMRCILSIIGANSADTATWRAKAAYGKIVVPGAGERYVGQRRIRYGPLYATAEDLETLEKFLRETGFPLLNGKGVGILLRSFRGRAMVNAWVLAHSPPVPGKGYRWVLKLAKHASSLSIEELERLHLRALKTQKIRNLLVEVETT